jgi:hypothetical protein
MIPLSYINEKTSYESNYIFPFETRKERFSDNSEKHIIHCFNRFHYGDNILNLKFFFNYTELLLKHKIHIMYYYDTSYILNINELQKYVNKETVSLHPISERPDDAHELWMGATRCFEELCYYNNFDSYYTRFYKNIKDSILCINDDSIITDIFQPEPYLIPMYNKLNDVYKNIDILIINCSAHSGQINFQKESLTPLCIELSKIYKVVTTEKVNDISCTRDHQLTIQDIGAISTYSKYIIAVNSGPVTACFNQYAKLNVKKWILFDNNVVYSKSNIYVLHHVPSLSECIAIFEE